MWCIALAAGLALTASRSFASDASESRGLAVDAVDHSLFRDGEVRRRNERYSGWSLDCDEIVRLGQRFCSLRSLALDASGAAVARITVSTDERGRPAALIDLPLGTDLGQPVVIEAQNALVVGRPSAALVPAARTLARDGAKRQRGSNAASVATDLLSAALPVNLCDRAGCHSVWPLAPAEVAALRAGAGLRLRFAMSGRAAGFDARANSPSRPLQGIVSSEGFSDALQASLH